MYNYFNFDGSQINDLAIVTSIEKPYIPERTTSTINVTSRDGELFDGMKYNPIKIPISLAIVGDDADDYVQRVKALSDIMNKREIVPIKFCDSCTIYGMLYSNFTVEKKNFCTGYANIEIICYDPFSYSDNVLVFDQDTGSKKSTVTNAGHEPTLPFISIGFSKDTHFAQIQNVNTGDRILVGDYPKLTLTQKSESTTVVYDKCESLSTITVTGVNIDANRSYDGGTFALSSSGESFILGSFNTSSSTWNGACARRSLGTSLDEFELRINMQHKSTGENGDPNLYDADLEEVKETVKSGSLETYYKCTSSKVNCRSGPGTNYKIVGTISKGYEIHNITPSNGWLHYTHKKYGKVYTKASVLKKCYNDTRKSTVNTYDVVNMWVQPESGNKTGAGQVLRKTPSTKGTAACTIPYGTKLRIIKRPYVYKYTDSDNREQSVTFYRLYKKYTDKNGKTYAGYMRKDVLVDAQDMTASVDYEDDPNYADDKTGMVELYGFDINGNKLFKMGLYDDNKYFEYTRPEVQIGSRTVLKDTSKTPTPISKNVASSSGNKLTTYLSGAYGSWNNFNGTFTLQRKKVNGNYTWNVTVQKKEDGKVVKTQSAKNIRYSDLPTAELNYLAVYMGTMASSANKLSAVGLSHISVYNLNPESEEEQDILYFHAGDVLDLDFENGNAYINDVQRNDLVDIGSKYFNIDPGTTTISLNTDDSDAVMVIGLKEKWLGIVDEDIATMPEDMTNTD